MHTHKTLQVAPPTHLPVLYCHWTQTYMREPLLHVSLPSCFLLFSPTLPTFFLSLSPSHFLTLPISYFLFSILSFVLPCLAPSFLSFLPSPSLPFPPLPLLCSLPHPPQMWAARAALLVHLRRYKEAELELAAFRELDNPDLYYQYHIHSYPGKTGEHLETIIYCLVYHTLPNYSLL